MTGSGSRPPFARPPLAFLVAWACIGACGDDDPPRTLEAPATEPAAPRPPLPAPEATSGPGGFELVVAGDDVLWMVAAPSRRGGGIQVRTLDGMGTPRGPWRPVVAGVSGRSGLAPAAIEVEAAVVQARLGVAWVERTQLEVRAWSVLGDAGGRTFGDPRELSGLRPFDPAAAPRGRVALARREGAIGVLHRRSNGPCESGAVSECARFAQARLGDEGEPDRGIGWSLPQPCPRPLVGAALAGSIHYHALCAVEEGQPRTTVFAIQFEPQYAHAEALLAGCQPVGLVPFADGVAVTGDCDGTRRGFWIAEAARTVEPLEPPQVSCRDGRPVLAWGDRREGLAAPRDGVGPLLPAGLAGPDDRAVWTGEAVLVATHQEREAVIRRYGCDRGTFGRLDPRPD